ncbi:phytoene desaturase [Aliifodinibius salipaludis]|uniref:Phytoene desaturase n=1 Tax=Fodinibius salipaludis TaxID=2032627 RepID=A0A2A2GF89_9BACT|nr:phytoene desaturase family protein [Aliifodinibius salipaludis]PAU95553.1 phytoene desaturase [Aliifodinibius salipaludis]
MDIKIIGAGLGGLATSCLLAQKGHDVTILEKNSTPGGKINEISAQGFRFDTGPSLLTMPFILEKLFEFCDAKVNNFLDIKPVDPICRYFYPNGIQFDCYQDSGLNTAQIQEFAPDDVQAYKQFITYAEQLFERTKDAFLYNPLYGLSDLSNINFTDFFKIDAFRTVAERIDKQFESEELQQFFKRFATYNGSSPYQAPATLNIIPYVELSLGGYYLDGGMYSLIKALTSLAESKGVNIQYDTEITKINTTDNRITGTTDISGNFYTADIVVSNSDASATYLDLVGRKDISILKRKKVTNVEPSCSGFVLMLGIDKTYNTLSHHNIFFSEDYEHEFRQIFEDKVMPEDPTIYVANTSHTNPEHAPEGGSNLFILVNAPYLNDNVDWANEKNWCKEQIIRKLQEHGLTDLRNHIQYSNMITPKDFYQKYRSNKGSIYGTSSNSKLAAFMRPKNKSRSIKGLYLVGGSTHPGGGIPLVTLSAFHAVELISRFEE